MVTSFQYTLRYLQADLGYQGLVIWGEKVCCLWDADELRPSGGTHGELNLYFREGPTIIVINSIIATERA